MESWEEKGGVNQNGLKENEMDTLKWEKKVKYVNEFDLQIQN